MDRATPIAAHQRGTARVLGNSPAGTPSGSSLFSPVLPAEHGGDRTRQRSLKNAIHCSGIGLHSGERATMTLHPADENTGIVFRRSDIGGRGATIPARWDQVVETTLCTTLGNDQGVRVCTVEHLMSAFAGMGIDNAVVEVKGPEVPIMDGSAAPFVFLIECAGIAQQAAARRVIEVLRPIRLRDGASSVSLMPADDWQVQCAIEFESAVIGRQAASMTVAPATFRAEIARARTFGFHQEVAQMIESGLARGGSMDNAVVVSGDRVLNEGGLRYEDEFVRHKVLDAIGDLYLAGGPLRARFDGVRPGHRLNNRLLRSLFADATAWRWTTAERSPEPRRQAAAG
ncbi:MAG: UDP-3-O-acyl-N-acetylglucosamine deacetylase [Alphaproteobacteria bacterium]